MTTINHEEFKRILRASETPMWGELIKENFGDVLGWVEVDLRIARKKKVRINPKIKLEIMLAVDAAERERGKAREKEDLGVWSDSENCKVCLIGGVEGLCDAYQGDGGECDHYIKGRCNNG